MLASDLFVIKKGRKRERETEEERKEGRKKRKKERKERNQALLIALKSYLHPPQKVFPHPSLPLFSPLPPRGNH